MLTALLTRTLMDQPKLVMQHAHSIVALSIFKTNRIVSQMYTHFNPFLPGPEVYTFDPLFNICNVGQKWPN